MERFSDWLSGRLYAHNQISLNNVNDISFALQVIFSNLLSFGIVVICGVMFQSLRETLIFVLLFAVFRSIDDRYHAKSYLGCLVLTVGSFLITLAISKVLEIHFMGQYILSVALLNCLVTMVVEPQHTFAPPRYISRSALYTIFMLIANVLAILLMFTVMKHDLRILAFSTSVMFALNFSIIVKQKRL